MHHYAIVVLFFWWKIPEIHGLQILKWSANLDVVPWLGSQFHPHHNFGDLLGTSKGDDHWKPPVTAQKNSRGLLFDPVDGHQPVNVGPHLLLGHGREELPGSCFESKTWDFWKSAVLEVENWMPRTSGTRKNTIQKRLCVSLIEIPFMRFFTELYCNVFLEEDDVQKTFPNHKSKSSKTSCAAKALQIGAKTFQT